MAINELRLDYIVYSRREIKNMIKRLFIKLPLFTLQMIVMFTAIVPIGYYIITGKNYLDFDSKLEDKISKL